MKQHFTLLFFWLVTFPVVASELKLESPIDFQVVQRSTKAMGRLRIKGTISAPGQTPDQIEIRSTSNDNVGEWQKIAGIFQDRSVEATAELSAGGWYRLDVQISSNGSVVGESKVDHVGIGEVFVVAGQSNSANYGEVRLTSQSGKVTTLATDRWQLSNDPQPGASGDGGSFIPPLGDALVAHYGVPVGFIACGIGATSVREWLPEGITFPNPPTLLHRVKQTDKGEWQSDGKAYQMLISRIKPFGAQGFRAILWHQGESDANQKDDSRTLEGSLYRKYLETLIKESQKGLGWQPPWFVAQATYHIPGDESSLDIRAAQASLWNDRIANEGPDTDTLNGDRRDSGGKGVHFSVQGQKEHAALWFERLTPWLDDQLSQPVPAKPALGRLPAARILFLGNSITLHAPKPDIGWVGNWGMAASSREKDYVHLVTTDLAKAIGKVPEIKVRNIAEFEIAHHAFDIENKFRDELAFQADLIIVAIGENVPELATDEGRSNYAVEFRRLLQFLKNRNRPTIFVRSSFWPDEVKDSIMRMASADAGVTFIDVSNLGKVEANAARSERKFDHAGVAAHPGDQGMRALADAIVAAIKARALSLENVSSGNPQ